MYDEQGTCNHPEGNCEYQWTDWNCEAGCLEGQCEDFCTGITCDQPPENICVDDSTLRVFEAQGTCNQANGNCEYQHNDQNCEDSCREGQCEGLCTGIACDQPPESICVDDSTLRVFEAQGTCNPEDGKCEYQWNDQTCEAICQEGQCENLCTGTTCNQPPESFCLDESTLRVFEAEGTCNPADGNCEYQWSDQICDQPPHSRCFDEWSIEEFPPVGICDLATSQCNYQGSLRACPDGCVDDQCLDLGDDFALVIPTGTQVCNEWSYELEDVFAEYNKRMRISFREGVVQLPQDVPDFEQDWIESIEFGPERTLLDPLSSGIFSMYLADNQIEYQFIQEFSNGSEIYTLTYSTFFDTTNTDDRTRIFDESYLSPSGDIYLSGIDLLVTNQVYDQWKFTTCRFDLYEPVLNQVQTADGAELDLELRSYFALGEICYYQCPSGLKQARFRLGQDYRMVDDPFRLAFVTGHHNHGDQFLVVFDDPVSDIHALYYYQDDPDAPQKKVEYLDQQLNVIADSLVTEHLHIMMANIYDPDNYPHYQTCQEYCLGAFYGVGCQTNCLVEDQLLSGRCVSNEDWVPPGEWTDLGGCDQTFDACPAGQPYVQCCCGFDYN